MLESQIDSTVKPKNFYLLRLTDVSGISGTGVVAFGTQFQQNSRCYVLWLGDHSSINEYNCIEDVIFVHGHNGSTKVVWLD